MGRWNGAGSDQLRTLNVEKEHLGAPSRLLEWVCKVGCKKQETTWNGCDAGSWATCPFEACGNPWPMDSGGALNPSYVQHQ